MIECAMLFEFWNIKAVASCWTTFSPRLCEFKHISHCSPGAKCRETILVFGRTEPRTNRLRSVRVRYVWPFRLPNQRKKESIIRISRSEQTDCNQVMMGREMLLLGLRLFFPVEGISLFLLFWPLTSFSPERWCDPSAASEYWVV